MDYNITRNDGQNGGRGDPLHSNRAFKNGSNVTRECMERWTKLKNNRTSRRCTGFPDLLLSSSAFRKYENANRRINQTTV